MVKVTLKLPVLALADLRFPRDKAALRRVAEAKLTLQTDAREEPPVSRKRGSNPPLKHTCLPVPVLTLLETQLQRNQGHS